MDEYRDKLLPYEHQLIDALGITKEEYLNFVAQQQIYADIKQRTVLDARNDFGLTAIVLTVVGLIFQVVAALIASPPARAPQIRAATPTSGGGVPATRDELFAPRFGFDTQQQLAAYGDPVNLVYTNIDANPDGGVRVATSLIWSALLSYGNSQLVKLLFALGGGGIGRVNLAKTAFGQTALSGLVAQNFWIYFRENTTGSILNSYLKPQLYGIDVADPTRIGDQSTNAYLIRKGDAVYQGFSHCYSPSSANQFGIYGAVPIHVDLFIRNAGGDFERDNNKIFLSIENGAEYIALRAYEENASMAVSLSQTTNAREGLATEEAKESRRSLASVFDNSGLFKFGSIKAKVTIVSRGDTIDGDMNIGFVIVERGLAPYVPYRAVKVEDVDPNSIFSYLTPGTYLHERRQQFLRAEQAIVPIMDEDSLFNSPAELLANGNIHNYVPTNWECHTESHYVQTDDGGFWTEREVCNPTEYGHRAARPLTDEERVILQSYVDLDNIAGPTALGAQRDDYFNTKALVRIEEAFYQVVSPCHIVDFSIKARVFKRISGRQEEYGSNRRGSGYSSADNGLKHRSSMFVVKIKRTTDSSYLYVPAIFVIRRAADIENFVYLRFDSNLYGAADGQNFQFKFEPVYDVVAEANKTSSLRTSNGNIRFAYLENSGTEQTIGVSLSFAPGAIMHFVGSIKESPLFPPINQQPAGTNEWDVFSVNSDTQLQFSFDNGPELMIAAVTEQIIDSHQNYPELYDNLCLIGLNLYSGKSVQDLRSFSVFAEQGRLCRLLRTSGTINGIAWGQPGFQYLSDSRNGYANTAPDIFIDTVLDVQDGIGRHASVHSIDLEQLAKSKKFCETNSLFMDGVIAEPVSWRQFWAQVSGFSLLELAKIGGQDVLIPAVPYVQNTGAITRQLSISALFNQGNIIEESYKEEFIDYGENTQDMIATVMYRKSDAEDTFGTNTSVDVQFADIVEANASRKTIDASAFVTRRQQAILMAKFLCNSKRYSQRAIEFKTFPTDSPVFPGAYIYVELAHNQWDGIYTGTIEDGGKLNLPVATSVPDGSNYSMLVYTPDGGASSTQLFTGVTVANNQARVGNDFGAFQNYVGKLFVIGTVVNNKRVFRVTEVQMDEEGEVTIRAVHHATDGNGLSMISRGLAETVSGLFLIDGRPE